MPGVRLVHICIHNKTKEKGEMLKLVFFACSLAFPMLLFVETQFYSLYDNVPPLFLRKVVLEPSKAEQVTFVSIKHLQYAM